MGLFYALPHSPVSSCVRQGCLAWCCALLPCTLLSRLPLCHRRGGKVREGSGGFNPAGSTLAFRSSEPAVCYPSICHMSFAIAPHAFCTPLRFGKADRWLLARNILC